MPERIDQDINFNLGDMACVMRLHTTGVLVDSKHDVWMIQPRDLEFVRRRDGRQFSVRILRAFERLIGMSEGIQVRTPRQQYRWHVCNEFANLFVSGRCYWSVTTGIMLSLPDWNGQSFNFFASYHLARLLADWKDAIPDIEFTRSNGSVIEYEQYIEEGGDPLTDLFDSFDEVINS